MLAVLRKTDVDEEIIVLFNFNTCTVLSGSIKKTYKKENRSKIALKMKCFCIHLDNRLSLAIRPLLCLH